MTYRIDLDTPRATPPHDFLQVILATAWQTGLLTLLIQILLTLITGESR